jgi:hypothetical protein
VKEENKFDGGYIDQHGVLFYLKDPQDPLPAALTKRRTVSLEESDDGDHSGKGKLEDVDG